MPNKLIFIFVFAFGFANILAQENKLNFPAPSGFVNDFADVLTAEEELKLENRLEKFVRNDSLAIAVATVKTTDGVSIDDYSLSMARRWQIGSKTKTNYGALLLIDVGNRKYRTQISRDLETVFSDARIADLQKQLLVPAFREKQFYAGIWDYLSGIHTDFAQFRQSENERLSAVFYQKKSHLLLNDSLQTIVVTTKDWKAIQGSARLFERKNKSAVWEAVGKSFPVVVGKNGLGWSVDAPVKAEAEPHKVEGDGRAPAGIFALTSAFGSHAKPAFVKLPFTRLTETIECVDDGNSKQYNRIVDNETLPPDWTSSEKMLAVGAQYDLGVFVAHNANPPQTGKGSCIFLHIWKTENTGTAGCTAMRRENVEAILRFLEKNKNPVLVQLTEENYKRFQTVWKLPKLK